MVIVVFALSGVTGVVTSRALGPYQRGILAAAVVWSTVVGTLINFGLQEAATYHVARATEQRSRVAGTIVALAGVLGLAFAVAGSGLCLVFVSGGATEPLAILFAAMLPNMLVAVCIGVILGVGGYRIWGLFRVFGPALSLLGVIVVIDVGARTALAVAWVTAVVSLAQLAVMLVVLRRRGLLGAPSKRLVAPMVGYMLRCSASGATWLIMLRLDQLVLSLTVVPSLLGIYAVSASFGDIVSSVSGGPAGQVMLRRASAGGAAAVRASLRRAIMSAVLVAGAVGAVLVVAAPLVIGAFFGHKFIAAVPSVRVLAIGAIFVSVSSVLADTLRGLGRPLVPARAETIGIVTTVLLLAVLIPLLGILGAAIASGVSYAVVTIALARNLRREMLGFEVVVAPIVPTS